MTKKNIETSKKLLQQTRAIFIGTLICAVIFSALGYDLSIFIYAIPAAGAVYGAAIGFYLNKAKMENIFKGRVDFLKVKLELLNKYPQHQEVIEEEINNADEAIVDSINSKMSDAMEDEKVNL